MQDNLRFLKWFLYCLRFLMWWSLGAKLRGFVKVGSGVRMKRCKNISLGPGVILSPFSYIKSSSGHIRLGEGVVLGEYSVIDSQESIVIGNDVLISPHCFITDSNHVFEDMALPISKQGRLASPTVIEDGAWIGCGAKVLAGVKVGANSVVAAGSVVTKDVESFTVVAGNPARLLKRF